MMNRPATRNIPAFAVGALLLAGSLSAEVISANTSVGGTWELDIVPPARARPQAGEFRRTTEARQFDGGGFDA